MSLIVITSYYNPEHYRSRFENFGRFVAGLESAGIRWMVGELAFGEDDFELPDHPSIVRMRGGDVMWQKERILNLLLDQLPSDAKYVAWMDCDLLFENPDWARETERNLKWDAVVQLFDYVVRLARGHASYRGEGEGWEGIGSIHRRSPNVLLGGDFAAHGHTGFAWAAHRAILEKVRLYDACIAGSGDHMMAHAFYGDWHSACVDRILCRNSFHVSHFERWCRAVYPLVRAKVGFTRGAIYHLWHGETTDRRYVLRNRELAAFGFDPVRDIRVGPEGLWEWTGKKSGLPDWARSYFKQRKEDAC